MTFPASRNLPSFVTSVLERAHLAVRDARFPASQKELLEATVARFEAHAAASDFAQPLGLLYLVFRAWGREPDDQAEHVGAFCFLYLCGLDLFDDVQDEDLAGKPHADAGPAIAMNSALALIFAALDALKRAIALEPDKELGRRFLSTFNEYSLLAVGCQHGDLLGEAEATTKEEVLKLHQGKTSAVALVMECGALLGRCDVKTALAYRGVGKSLAGMVQIVDDLRDVFSKETSPDLVGEKLTFPLACFRELATEEQQQRFEALVRELPRSTRQVGELYYESGAVEHCAATLEMLRLDVHERIAALGNAHSAQRLLLGIIDSLAGAVYECDPVEASAYIRQPKGEFYDSVRREVELFQKRMHPLGAPRPPKLEPWHSWHYMYDPARGVVYYPDLDGLKEEVLPTLAGLLGASDAEEAERVVFMQLPLLVAHELFHFWRDTVNRLSSDAWHEEYAANRLAVAYARRFYPDRLEATLKLGARLVERSALSDGKAKEILDRCAHPSRAANGYELDPLTSVDVHFEMIRRIDADAPLLALEVFAWLTPSRSDVAEAAA